jgi:hypothetical protein
MVIPAHKEHDEGENHKRKMQAIPVVDQSRCFAAAKHYP